MCLSKRDQNLNCTKFKQLFVLFTFFVLNPSYGLEANTYKDDVTLEKLGVNFNVRERLPATIQASEDGFLEPVKYTKNIHDILIEDNAGVLSSVRNNLKKWGEDEEYAQLWNMRSTGLFRIVDATEKKDYINSNIIRYLDRRLAGEIKSAEKGSTLRKVGEVQKALKPNTNVRVSKSVNIKFRARVLQGKAFMVIKNPIAECETILDAEGQVKVNFQRKLKSVDIQSHVKYDVNAGQWNASFDKRLTNNWKTRLSTYQSDKEMAFSQYAEKRLELFFNLAF